MYLHETLETLSRDGIEKLQMERLRKTLNHCLNSPFYRKRLLNINSGPKISKHSTI
jgi:phenylacetate-CoA ligase